MSQRLGKRKRKELGIFKKGEDAMSEVPIEPEFYAILKDEGFPTSRRPDGSYWDKSAQIMWEKWKQCRT